MMLRCYATFCTFFIIILSANCEVLKEFNWDVDGVFDPTKLLGEFSNFHGYPFEVHYVNNYDGYILQLHRIPQRNNNSSKPREAVLLMHGLLSSSADWLVQGPKRSLAFILHDHGYDVWLGNSRGNTFSRNHTKLSPTDKAFWNFSWHEIGINDASASIDYIRNTTGLAKIFYIGYSQGGTQFWVLMSMRPEYNDRVKLMIALAPAGFMGHVRGVTKMLAGVVKQAADLYEKTGYFEMFRASSDMRRVSKIACKIQSNTTGGPLCEIFMSMFSGYSEDTDYENLAKYTRFVPAGCSCKQFLHYGQNIMKPGRFRLYSYSPETNMKLYNSTEPPDYPLHKITVPVAVYNSQNDFLAAPEDVALMRKALPNLVDKYTVKKKQLNHIDFIYGRSITTMVYDRIVARMREYSDAP